MTDRVNLIGNFDYYYSKISKVWLIHKQILGVDFNEIGHKTHYDLEIGISPTSDNKHSYKEFTISLGDKRTEGFFGKVISSHDKSFITEKLKIFDGSKVKVYLFNDEVISIEV